MTQRKAPTVTISQATYDFLAQEIAQVHALCDRAQVPAHIDGAELSMAQRVAVLEGVCAGLARRLGSDAIFPPEH